MEKVKEKIKTTNFGFTLIELLVAIVVIAILAIVIMISITTYLNKGKDTYNAGIAKQISIAAKDFYPENNSRLPLAIGKYDYVTLKELASLKYLSKEVVDARNESCMNESYVAVQKTEKGLDYTVCLICGEGENRKSYIENKKACNKENKEKEEIVKPITCKISEVDKNMVKFSIYPDTTSVSQLTSLGYYNTSNPSNEKGIALTENNLSSVYDLSKETPGEYKFFIYTAGNKRQDCNGSITVEKESEPKPEQLSRITCKASSTSNKDGTRLTTKLSLSGGETPINRVNKILQYREDGSTEQLIETFIKNNKDTPIPSDLSFETGYGEYIYKVTYDNNTTITCTGASTLTLPNLKLTKKFVSTSAYNNTYKGNRISDKTLDTLSDFTLTMGNTWKSGYVYVRINNKVHFSEIKVDGKVITGDYFWISKEGNITTKVIATGNDYLKPTKSASINSKLDRTAPTILLSNSSSENWTNKDVTITATAQEEYKYSAIDKTSLKYRSKSAGGSYGNYHSQGDWTTNTATNSTVTGATDKVVKQVATRKYTSNQNIVFQAKVCDKAGNCSTSKETAVKIDKTKPTITIKNDSNEEWTNKDVTLTITATDSRSGLKKDNLGYYQRKYNYTNSEWNDWSSKNTSSWTKVTNTTSSGIITNQVATKKYTAKDYEGNRGVKVEVCDIAGNCNTTTITRVKIDITPPKCAGFESLGKNTAGNMEFRYKFEDKLSGVAKERHGHCYADSGKILKEHLCKTSTTVARLNNLGSGWNTTFSGCHNCSKRYDYKYGKGSTAYILFEIMDTAGNKALCQNGSQPYKYSYTHSW